MALFSYKQKWKKEKKAQIQDIIFFAVLLFGLAFALVIGRIVLNKFNSALEEGNLQTTESRQALVDWGIVWPTFDNMILIVLVLLAIGLIITSFMIPTHPIFLVINVFGIFFLVFIGAVLSNMYYDIIVSDADLVSSADNFPKINFVMNYLPYILAVLIFITTIVMYSRSRAEGG